MHVGDFDRAGIGQRRPALRPHDAVADSNLLDKLLELRQTGIIAAFLVVEFRKAMQLASGRKILDTGLLNNTICQS